MNLPFEMILREVVNFISEKFPALRMHEILLIVYQRWNFAFLRYGNLLKIAS